MVKIFVALPVFNYQDLTVRKNQEKICKSSMNQVVMQEVVGFSPEKARSIMIDNFLKTDFDFFLNLDADMIFLDNFNPIDKLVLEDKDIIGSLYFFKKKPCQPVYRPFELQEVYEKTGKFPEKFDWKIPDKPFEVMWIGNGFKLVKREIIKKMREKFLVPNMTMEYKGEYLSEDWAFDQRAREMGFKVWLDPTLNIGHVGSYIYTKEDFERYYPKEKI
jgi:hypothetical protein